MDSVEGCILARSWAHARGLWIADGRDEVHHNQIARLELARWKS